MRSGAQGKGGVNGSLTPEAPKTINEEQWFTSAKRVLNLVFPNERQNCRVVDLGCLEGGFSVEFARLGFETLGIEVRDSNFQCCEYVKQHTDLPNLSFAKDNVLNISKYGEFDVAFCCGLLYHLDRPRAFLEQLAKQTKKLLIINTHFSLAADNQNTRFKLSPLTINESLKGRWYGEFAEGVSMNDRDASRWSSFENNSSFWIQREELLGLIYNLGFGTVFEQFDSLAPNISSELESSYTNFMRGTFIGIKD